MTPTQPAFVETPLHAVPDRQIERVIVDRFEFQVERPADSYALLDDPVVLEAHERDEYMPYWADLWPAARMLAKAVAKEDWSHCPRSGDKPVALELGCGLGVPGLTALARGLHCDFQRLRSHRFTLCGSQRTTKPTVRLQDDAFGLAIASRGFARANHSRRRFDL